MNVVFIEQDNESWFQDICCNEMGRALQKDLVVTTGQEVGFPVAVPNILINFMFVSIKFCPFCSKEFTKEFK